MANRYTNLVGSRKISEDFNNINIGFDRVQAEMDTKGTPQDAQTKADAAKQAAIDAAAAALTAHKARGADEHPTAKGNAAGFMSAADKLKSDASTNASTPDTLMQRDAAGRAKVAAPVAADEIARKAETDAVQSNLESHAADTSIHVTAADHTKLDGIAEGAEVNQNAFSGVNGVVATSKSDTLQITGGTGITITEDPATKRVIVTSTGTATPGAHASSHVTGGSDVIPDVVTDGASGLMSGADAKFVRVDGETKAGAQAKADEVKDYIESRLDNPERSAITLQPGIHVVQADQDAAFRLAGLQGRTVLNYQSQVGIFGVLNPYVIRYGVNLLPPFYEWSKTGHTSSDTDPYGLMGTLVSSAIGSDAFASYNIDVIGNQDYTLSNPSSSTGFMRISTYNSAGTRIQGIFVKPGESKTIKMAATAVRLSVVLSGVTAYTDEFDSTKWTWQAGTSRIFTKPMLTLGTIGKPFKPREDAMLALQTELHANPDTGDNPDMVFERDGQYFKLAKWRKVVLDGSFTYRWLSFSSSTFKIVGCNLLSPAVTYSSFFATKYNGSLLTKSGNMTGPDNAYFRTSELSDFNLSVSNADSGWGDAYTPTADEIKAYFMGWVMFNGSAGTGSGNSPDVPANNVYNGTGTKWWVRRSDGVTRSWVDATSVLPTTQAPNWTPYQLLYQLATPVVEPITSEGQLTFVEGANQVEVGTGIVLRESAKPQISDYGTYINSAFPGFEQTKLKYRTSKILTLFKNGKFDPSWVRNTLDAYGAERAVLSAYDPSAAYSVTYLLLDKYPTVDFTGTYAENEKALLLDTVRTLQENTTRISVLESKKAEKDAPAWIAPTLLNGWVIYNDTLPVGYYKDSNGIVRFKGMVKSGALNSILLKLPPGYRPKNMSMQFVAHSSDGSGQVLGRIIVNANGDVQPYGGSTTLYSLDSISFLAEQ
ncbi:hypothetical protein NSQ38_03225 [Paenibacillus sp. FSL R7-0313]|uniref:hypothetical protein n=1 Tax=Paenibacillus sp. FSL R7-0313 TaxID=2954532 RepID=UPI0030DABED9